MEKIFFKCICGEKHYLISNLKNSININICSSCHSLFSKNVKFNSSNRVKYFNKKYENFFKK